MDQAPVSSKNNTNSFSRNETYNIGVDLETSPEDFNDRETGMQMFQPLVTKQINQSAFFKN